MNEEKKWILSLGKDEKLFLMHEVLKAKDYSMWFRIIDMLLEAPISSGGMSTDEIDSIWYKYMPKLKQR